MDVVFAVLPFADVERPAIGVSLLKAEVEGLGFSSKVLYLNFDLAEMIGIELCGFISESLPADTLVGEWFFADLLFGDRIPDPLDYVAKILSFNADVDITRRIVDARKHRAQFLERAMSRFMQLKPRVVGFTTTFHQTCACLLLAQRLKRQSNPPFIVFGGANCEGEMGLELLRRFDFIDYVCTREGDVAFPLLLENLLRQQKFVAIPGMVRQGESTVLTTPDLVRDLNSLPIPDYADYFERVAESPLAGTFKSDLLIETSRGCWWGAKHHCTFCGLNGDTMEFRRKSPQRAYEEMKFLSAKYGVKRINCVDNILDTRLIPTLFPMLVEGGLDLELFYEVKANLRYDQLELMRAGGVTSVQPGIESFSDRILSLMEKGSTGLMNIQLLRWCEELGILPAWNILSGFPGEAPADYEWTAQLLPRLTHLQPPSACSPIRLDRFSPFFTRAQRFGFEGIRPSPAYYYVYPFGRREMARLAYFFDFDYADGRNPRTYLVNVRREVDNWYMLRNPSTKPEDYPRLDAKCVDDGALLITDTRPCAPAPSHVLTGSEAQVLLACDHYQSFTVLARQFRPALDEIKLRDLLASLESQALLVSQNNKYVALPIFRERQEASGKKCHVDAEI
jgi:ribosomal peptide maturation radical SAM protein 1